MSHLNVDDFHGQSERWVSRELCVHVVRIILTRLFTNRCETGIVPDGGKPEMQANFRNGLAVVTRYIGNLLLEQAAVLSETVTRIAVRRQRLRPNRPYERRSPMPAGRWRS